MMKKTKTLFTRLLLIGVVLFLLTGCAESIPIDACLETEPYGFLGGLWHGIISPFSFIAGLCGGVYAHFIGVLTPELMSTTHVIEILTITYIGGRGSIWGSLIAALLILPIFEYLNFLMEYKFLI